MFAWTFPLLIVWLFDGGGVAGGGIKNTKLSCA